MNRLTLTKDRAMDTTVVSNLFIDEYMADANDAQIKIYLYLLRLLNAGISTNVSELADKFNFLEQDVVRCITYWEKKGLVKTLRDSAGELCSISFVEPSILILSAKSASEDSAKEPGQIVLLNPVSANADTKKSAPAKAETMEDEIAPKPEYSVDDLANFKKDDSISQIIFIAESYLGRSLSATDLRTLIYIYKELSFSTELIDYLIEYCVERGKKQMRYIEAVAIGWSKEHIVTVRQAKLRANKFDKAVYTIMNALGRTNAPTDSEAEFIQRWYKEYAFSLDVILEACKRTVLATQSHRFEYTEAILKRWKEAKVRNVNDIKAEEERYNKAKAQKPVQKKPANNSFNNFSQRDYDYDELMKQLKSN